jgi:ParB family chromosome partitioning protein
MILGQKTRIPVSRIASEKQVREDFNEERITGLAATMGRSGQLQAVIVRKSGDRFILLDGERRWRAAKLAGITELDATVVDRDLSPAEILELSLTANIQREDLTPLEKARGIDSLMTETGWNGSEVAQRLGMSNATVSRLLTLLTLPEEIQVQVASGKIAPSAAAELAKVKDAERRSDLAGQLASGKLTRDEVAKAAKKPKRRGTAPKPASERMIAMLGLGRVVSVFAPSLSIESVIELLEELLSKARKAKAQSLSLATFSKLLEDQCRT